MRKIGKRIGGNIYVHRDYVGEVLFNENYSHYNFIHHQASFNQDYDPDWAVLKVSTNSLSFISCPTFDTEPEPVVGDSLHAPYKEWDLSIVFVAHDISLRKGGKYVYHHKWMMVGDDYEGFDVEESKKRSEWWESKYKGPRHGIGLIKNWQWVLEHIKSC